MRNKPRHQKSSRQKQGLSDCLACGGRVLIAMQALEASDGMSGGWFPLCPHCYAHYCETATPAGRDYFLDCLTEELFRRLARR
jgi:hypothetical protein